MKNILGNHMRPALMVVLSVMLVISAFGFARTAAAAATAHITSCGDCHGYPPVDSATRNGATGQFPGSHTMHTSTPGGYNMPCTTCHVDNTATYTHRNGFIDMKNPINGNPGGAYSKGSVSFPQTNTWSPGSCSNVYCHSQGTGATLQSGDTRSVSVSLATLTWGDTDTCTSCHGTPPSYQNGTPKANSHPSHTTDCSTCHYGTTTDNATIANKTKHANGYYDIIAKPGVSIASYSYAPTGGTCYTVSCHLNGTATWGVTGSVSCLTCHSGIISNGTYSRANVIGQFSANSHHVQRSTAVATTDCYQCHWEANSSGKTTQYHSGAAGGTVDLVVRPPTTTLRPTIYSLVQGTTGTTAVQYTSYPQSRTEMAKINTVCLGCHQTSMNTVAPFTGDTNAPNHYAWDGQSIDSRYTQTGTTPWGKYSGANFTPKDTVTKAFSAHGQATLNQGGWDTNETWPNNRNGTVNVLCYDCHNSHGSNVAGSTTSYTPGTYETNGGILKNTLNTVGGYTADYTPVSNTSNTYAPYNPGAALCFDCHMNASPSSTRPWGYQSTFGDTQAIYSYEEKPFWYGAPSSNNSGRQMRYAYKSSKGTAGSHFGHSSPLITSPTNSISGLCTPCHDPHGVSPTDVGYCSNAWTVTKATCTGTWTPAQEYGVPMLKGTWLTSPYREDAAPLILSSGGPGGQKGGGSRFSTGYRDTSEPGYHIDQNTFTTMTTTFTTTLNALGLYDLTAAQSFTPSEITQNETQFGGLCLKCHPKSELVDNTTTTWGDYRRIHKTVKGWAMTSGNNANNKTHAFPCSKCHGPHSSCLPRLLMTNCTDWNHRGRVATGGTRPPNHSISTGSGGGRGRHPFGGGGYGRSTSVRSWTRSVSSGAAFYFGSKGTTRTSMNLPNATCHSSVTGTYYENYWNSKSPW